MAILYKRIENLNYLKSLLMTDFGMKSSHASEAIAALAGFKSHAAFRAKDNSVIGPFAVRANFELFEARSKSMGYDLDGSEHLRYIYSSLNWPHKAWILYEKRDRASRDNWFYSCRRQNVPFLTIEKARKYCTLSWDHISFDRKFDQPIRDSHEDELGHLMFRLYQAICRGWDPKSFFEGSWTVGEITKLSESSARQLANEFFILMNPGNLPKESRIAA